MHTAGSRLFFKRRLPAVERIKGMRHEKEIVFALVSAYAEALSKEIFISSGSFAPLKRK